MKEKVLVVGGLGFIGSNLSVNLAARGYEVLVYDNLSNGTGRALIEKYPEIKLVKGDILDYPHLEEVVNSVDYVYNLAVRCLPESLDNPLGTHMVNDVGTVYLCMACKNMKKKLLHVSSSEVYGTAIRAPMDESHPLEPTTPYGASKAASEMIVKGFCRCYGMEAVMVRPFNSYGPFMREDSYSAVLPRFIACARRNEPLIIFGDGRQTRDLTYIDDTVEGIALAGEAFPEGATINIARGEEIRILDLAELVIGYYAQKGIFRLKNGVRFTKPRPGDVRRHFANISRAKKLLGFKPGVNIEEGVRRYAEWYDETHPPH